MKSSTTTVVRASSNRLVLLIVAILTLTKIRQSVSFTTSSTTIYTTPPPHRSSSKSNNDSDNNRHSSIPPSLALPPNAAGKCPRHQLSSTSSESTTTDRTTDKIDDQPPPSHKPQRPRSTAAENRRSVLLRRPLGILLSLAASSPFSPLPPRPAFAASRRWENASPPPSSPVPPPPQASRATGSGPGGRSDIDTLRDACTALQSLLDNWDKATIDCAYADVPRELLESKNKEQLLEKAATFALFDKGAVAVSCRRTNRLVRDYIGVTGKGPLVGLEKRLLGRGVGGVVERVDPDLLDEYYSEVDSFSRAISRAASLSYTAGMADLNSVNNFAKEEEPSTTTTTTTTTTATTSATTATTTPAVQSPEDSNLEQARSAVIDAKGSIDRILKLLSSGSDGAEGSGGG